MITKEKALVIATEYLKSRKREFEDIDKVEDIIFKNNKKVLYGKYKEEIMPTYTIGYGQFWGLEIRSMFIIISAETGEVLYSMSPTSWIEELEDGWKK